MRLLTSFELAPAARAAIAPLRPHVVERFDPCEWRGLREATARQLGCCPADLDLLHEIEAARGGPPRKARRRTTGSRLNVDALADLVSTYEAFVCRVIAPHVAARYGDACDAVVFQAMPSLRVATPSDQPNGQRHRDGDYGHQPGQINWWLPLTRCFGRNTLWLEPAGGGEARPLEGEFGTLHRFHGHAQHHFTCPNDTGTTRVSLDFRTVPWPCYDDDWPASRSPATGQQAFFLGGYYAKAERDGTTGEWRVARSASEERDGPLRGNAAKRQRAAVVASGSCR